MFPVDKKKKRYIEPDNYDNPYVKQYIILAQNANKLAYGEWSGNFDAFIISVIIMAGAMVGIQVCGRRNPRRVHPSKSPSGVGAAHQPNLGRPFSPSLSAADVPGLQLPVAVEPERRVEGEPCTTNDDLQ